MFIKTEQDIIKNWNHNSMPLVSVVCIVYNHEKFLSQAIDSFLMQETNFSFEIVIGEDCSTDNSLEVIKTYQNKYPNLIRLITSENNVGMQRNFLRTMDSSKGKYIALCEGDDYWCDKDKLQKQVDYLGSDDKCVLVHNNSKIVDEKNNLLNIEKHPNIKDYSSDEMKIGSAYILTNTVMFRNKINSKNYPSEFMSLTNMDATLWHLLGFYGFAKYLENIKNDAYRYHSSSVWSHQTIFKKIEHSIKTRLEFRDRLNDYKLQIALDKYLKNFYFENLKGQLYTKNIDTFNSLRKVSNKYEFITNIDMIFFYILLPLDFIRKILSKIGRF